MTRAEFNGGWKTLQGVGWPNSAERDPDVYFSALEDLDARQWAQAVKTAVLAWEFFPVPKTLRTLSGAVVALSVEASAAFEQVCGATVHRLLHQGQAWCDCTEDRYDAHLLRERLGAAAADGFLAAGGPGAFVRRQEGDPFLLQRFSAAYVETVKASPESGLQMLPAPAERPAVAYLPPVSRWEATRAVEQVADRSGIGPAPAKSVPPAVVVTTPERVAELKAQLEASMAPEGGE